MTETGCGRMRPLYEAMAVCSSTIEWLEREEKKRADYEFQACIAKLIKAIEDFINFVGNGIPAGEIPTHTLAGLTWCVETLNSMTQLAVRKTREALPTFSVEFHESIALMLNQVDSLTVKVEDILESWQLAADKAIAYGFEALISQVDKTKTEIPDWREALEAIVSN